jgi:hypothetical protein
LLTVPSGSLAVAVSGTSAGAWNGPAGVERVTVGGWFTDAPPQVTPLSVNEVGLGLLPVCEPLKPKLTEPPVGTLPFQAALVAVTWLPVCVTVADQAWVTRCPEFGNVHPRFQAVSGSPRFCKVTLAVKPVFQSLVA